MNDNDQWSINDDPYWSKMSRLQPDSNQTPPSLLRLLKKKGASFSTTSIAAPAMMPVFKPSEIEHIEMTKPKLNKGRHFPGRKWRHIMSYSCNFLTSFGTYVTCSNLFCKTSSSTSSSRRPPESPESRRHESTLWCRWVHHGRCWQSSCARHSGIPRGDFKYFAAKDSQKDHGISYGCRFEICFRSSKV